MPVLDLIGFSGFSHRPLSVPAWARITAWLVVLAPAVALAGKDHCRLVELDGAASGTSADIIRIRVVDKTGRVLDQSCPIQVKSDGMNGEGAVDFTRRFPAVWGPGTGAVAESNLECPSPVSGPLPPLTTPNKTCGGVNGVRSCKHTFIYKVKNPPVLPQLLICCTRSTANPAPALPDCKGKKLNKVKECIGGGNSGALCVAGTDCLSGVCEATTPLTVQIFRNGDPAGFKPGPVPPQQGAAVVQAALDPIAVIERALPTQLGCRTAVGSAMTTLVTTAAQALVHCHHDVMGGGQAGVDCNSTSNADPAAVAKIAAAVSALRAVINEQCAPKGSPTTFGYAQCPAPCNFIPPNTSCTAGTVGTPCTHDPECDTTRTCTAGTVGLHCIADAECDASPGDGRCEGSLDGRCGDWNATADCLACLAEDGVSTAVEDKYGTPGPGPGLPVEVERCQDGIGKALALLAQVHVAEIASCQRLVDAGKGALGFCRDGLCTAPLDVLGQPCSSDDACSPLAERTCKFADPKGRRAQAELVAATEIVKSCLDDATVAQLTTCDTTIPDVQQCVIQNGRDLAETIADAMFP
jgi:hypothetical protein